MQANTYLCLSVPLRYPVDNIAMKNECQKIKEILVKNIKKHRAKRKLTQENAAELAGFTSKYWQRLEMISQSDLPSLKVLFKIARALETSPAKLLDE